MPAEMLTYAAISDRPAFWSAFQAFVNRLWLPRQRKHSGNALAAVDTAERPTVAAHSPEGDQSVVATLTARIETLESEFAKVEAAAAAHRADFERERDRCDRLMAEMLKGTSKNSPHWPRITKLPSNDSALFPFRFVDVHVRRVRDWF
jgi:hypothetical protein